MFALLDTVFLKLGMYLKYVAAGLLIAVALLIATDVSLRTLFNRPIIGIAEIVANGMVIIAFLQLSYTVRIGAMLRSELLLNFIGRRGRIVLETVVALLGVLFFGLIAWASYPELVHAIASGEFEGHASFQVPTWPVRAIIVGCSVLAVLNYLTIAVAELTGREIASMTDGDAPAGSGQA